MAGTRVVARGTINTVGKKMMGRAMPERCPNSVVASAALNPASCRRDGINSDSTVCVIEVPSRIIKMGDARENSSR